MTNCYSKVFNCSRLHLLLPDKFYYETEHDNFYHTGEWLIARFHPKAGSGQVLAKKIKNKQMNPDLFNELVRHRRSVFPDQLEAGKKVDDKIINEILINATWAPNHGQQQPWHFTVFTGDGLKKLAAFQSELYKQKAGSQFKEITYGKLQNNPLKASHIIAIGMKRTLTKNIPEIEDIEAVACAVQNIYLSITAYGLGGYWTTGGVTYYEEAKSFFGLEGQDKLLGFFYIGYTAIPSTGATRLPLEEKVTWVNA